MASETEICNRALQMIGDGPIVNLTEDSPRARECNRAYEPIRDAELRKHVWSFARARASLAASSTSPAFGYDNQFQLPSDFIRLYPTREVTDWQIEGDKILTDDEAPLKIIYVKRVTDVNKFDPLFREALSARIASEIADRLGQLPATNQELLLIKYDEAIKHAKRVNAIERVSMRPPDDDWVTVRTTTG